MGTLAQPAGRGFYPLVRAVPLGIILYIVQVSFPGLDLADWYNDDPNQENFHAWSLCGLCSRDGARRLQRRNARNGAERIAPAAT
jgi:hypothetical protein